MELSKRISKAKTVLLLDHPFYGTLATKLQLEENSTIDTAATDGKRLWYNADWLRGLSDAEIEGVLAHEVMHVANGHCWRRGDRDKERWNIACDEAINQIITDSGLTLPAEALAGRSGSAESLYSAAGEAAAAQQQEGSGAAAQQQQEGSSTAAQQQGGSREAKGPGGGEAEDTEGITTAPNDGMPGEARRRGEPADVPDPGGCGAVVDAPADEQGEMEADWRGAVAQAAQIARGMGKMPAGLERQVQQIINPPIPLDVLLRDFVERSAHNDYDWRAPNRRHLGRGIILPSLISEELQEAVVVIDTSGSIDGPTVKRFTDAVSTVLSAYQATVHVLYADAEVHSHEDYRTEDLPIEPKPIGGGGTDFRPAFSWVEEEAINPSCLVYLTDMAGMFPTEEPDYPVLWVAVGRDCIYYKDDAPFGEVVLIDAER